MHFKDAFVNAGSSCHGKLWCQSCVIRFNGILLIQPLQFFQLAKGKSVKASALSIKSISSGISHLMESKMAPDLFAILTH